jgi:NAD dependent epimerase/dehydratase family enzyme
VSGPVNATAPEPVTNRDFSRALGRALGRPAVLPTPVFALKLLYGDFAEILATGQRVMPARAVESGYAFRFPDLGAALAEVVGRG